MMSRAKTPWKKWLVLTVFGAVLSGAFPAFAEEFHLGGITVSDPFARASAGPAKAGAAYLTITNEGAETDLLVAASTAAANTAQVHATAMVDGVMKMRRVEAVEINPGEPTVLRPGGLHVMLMGLRAPLVKGQKFALTLTFEKAGAIEVDVPVLGVGATAPLRDHGENNGDVEAM